MILLHRNLVQSQPLQPKILIHSLLLEYKTNKMIFQVCIICMVLKSQFSLKCQIMFLLKSQFKLLFYKKRIRLLGSSRMETNKLKRLLLWIMHRLDSRQNESPKIKLDSTFKSLLMHQLLLLIKLSFKGIMLPSSH